MVCDKGLAEMSKEVCVVNAADYSYFRSVKGKSVTQTLFGVLGSRCLTGSALLDCHALKGFGIYMIGILDSLYGVWKPITGTRHVTSPCNLLDNITRVLSQPSFSFCL